MNSGRPPGSLRSLPIPILIDERQRGKIIDVGQVGSYLKVVPSELSEQEKRFCETHKSPWKDMVSHLDYRINVIKLVFNQFIPAELFSNDTHPSAH